MFLNVCMCCRTHNLENLYLSSHLGHILQETKSFVPVLGVEFHSCFKDVGTDQRTNIKGHPFTCFMYSVDLRIFSNRKCRITGVLLVAEGKTSNLRLYPCILLFLGLGVFFLKKLTFGLAFGWFPFTTTLEWELLFIILWVGQLE